MAAKDFKEKWRLVSEGEKQCEGRKHYWDNHHVDCNYHLAQIHAKRKKKKIRRDKFLQYF